MPGVSKFSGESSDILRDCGLALGVFAGKSGQSVTFGLIVFVEVESNEYEFGKFDEQTSALVGGVISTFTSTDSPASEED